MKHLSKWLLLVGLLVCLGLPNPVVAGVKSKAVREATEYVLRKFGKETARETMETLARKMEVFVARHGDEFLEAVKKVGPATFHLIEQAGEHGPQAVRLLARFGDDAIWVIARPKGLAIFVKYGEPAGKAMIRHKGIAEPIIEGHVRPAIRALNALQTRNGRRLAIMMQRQELEKIGRTPELLDVVGKYGDRAMEFVWKHKEALTVSVVLAAFLADPEPFLDGAKDITKIAAETALKPLAEAPGKIAQEAVRGVNFTVVVVVMAISAAVFTGVWVLLKHRNRELLIRAPPKHHGRIISTFRGGRDGAKAN